MVNKNKQVDYLLIRLQKSYISTVMNLLTTLSDSTFVLNF